MVSELAPQGRGSSLGLTEAGKLSIASCSWLLIFLFSKLRRKIMVGVCTCMQVCTVSAGSWGSQVSDPLELQMAEAPELGGGNLTPVIWGNSKYS